MGVALRSVVTLPPVGDPDDDLLGPHGLAGAQKLGHRELAQGNLTAVGPPEGHHVEEVPQRLVRIAQAVDDPSSLLVEGFRGARHGVENEHSDGGCVDQGLKVCPGPLLLPVPSGVGDGHRRLGGEEDQRLLVLPRELSSVRPVSQIDCADTDPPVTNRGHQQGGRRYGGQELGHVQCSQVAVYVRDPQGLGKTAEVLEEPQPFRHVPEPLVLLVGQAGDDEVSRVPVLSKDGDRPVARGGERPCAVHHALQHGVEIEVLRDAKAGLAQAGEALLQIPYPLVSSIRPVQLRLLDWSAGGGRTGASRANYAIFAQWLQIVT